MKHDIIRAKILGSKIISQVSDEIKSQFELNESERTLGFLTTDCDDASYVALDAATKTAAVRVVYARSMYAGSKNASTALAGEFIGIIAGDTPSEVRSGLQAAAQYLGDGCSFVSANDDNSIVYFAHCISRSGSYLSQLCNVPEGQPLAYLIAPPMEAMIGLDDALKSADVTMAKFYGPPTETNFAGGILTGDQAACMAACEAFAAAIEKTADDPLNY